MLKIAKVFFTLRLQFIHNYSKTVFANVINKCMVAQKNVMVAQKNK